MTRRMDGKDLTSAWYQEMQQALAMIGPTRRASLQWLLDFTATNLDDLSPTAWGLKAFQIVAFTEYADAEGEIVSSDRWKERWKERFNPERQDFTYPDRHQGRAIQNQVSAVVKSFLETDDTGELPPPHSIAVKKTKPGEIVQKDHL